MVAKKIKVLIVDDSLMFREVLSKGLSTDPGIEVVAKASDPFDARDKIIETQPDVMTCDIEMPKMNGIEFVRRLMPQYPLPTIMVSTVSTAVFDAMNAGAVDFVTKPEMNLPKSVENFFHELVIKIKIAANARVAQQAKYVHTDNSIINEKPGNAGIIAVGASTGGTEAIYKLLKPLPVNVPGIVIVQHIPPVFSRMFADRLNSQTNLTVKEAENGDYVEKGKVIIAPGDRHIRVKRIGERYKIDCFQGDKVNGHCPSVDVLFESVAREAGMNAVGIILTGMGSDGAKGLLEMRRAGARTMGQDEASCVVYGMPKSAYETGAVERQASISAMSSLLISMVKE